MHALKSQPHQDKSRQLQRKLYLSAKLCRERRFHALFDRIYRLDILWRAWKEVKANRGSTGVDGVSIEDIESGDVEEYLRTLAKELKEKQYHSKPVLRIYIPKSDGKERALGIPTVRDRIVQQACKIVIEPIFEASFDEASYGFRPKRSATQAVQNVKEAMIRAWWVVDADIKNFFDNVEHDILLGLIKRRISDRRVITWTPQT